jgi:formylglycine-generating enzyme required for sulfatase activity
VAYANTYEGGLSRTIAVGLYPQGASPVGALDMNGNVNEWCLNEYETPRRAGLSGTVRRVVRGGSWNDTQDRVRAAYTYVLTPGLRGAALGLRVARSSPGLA